ncbi:hypothetical protein [Algibacillus agarilyticus]|uniref:hypothetical protein n=1 Tax=Algibacillus agarilyticus TaxID=2234133 RepID=UPI001300AB13|nr:hypothetical protein [Algibacillus agarilyticus]
MFSEPVQLDSADFIAPEMAEIDNTALESVIGILQLLEKDVEELKSYYQPDNCFRSIK